ncbi:hypothetical protein P5673_030047, partial [Acropora cervicornis]
MNIDKNRKIRDAHRTFVYKTVGNVEKILTEHVEDLTSFREKLTALKSLLIEKLETTKRLDETILEIAKSRELEKEIEDSREFCEHVYSILAKIDLRLEEGKHGVCKQTPVTNQEISNTGNTKSAKVKLPKIELKSFSGNYQEWQGFWDTFQSAVDGNTSISAIEKFTYLKSCVTSNAESAIAGLPLTADNYKVAIDILKDRFGKPQLLISNYMDALLKLPSVNSVHETKKLRELFDKIEINIRGLNALGVESQSFGNLLVPIVMEKIPSELRLVVSRKFGSEESWNLDALLSALKTELEARERCIAMKTSGPNVNTTKFEQYRARNKQPYSASALYTGSEEFTQHCVFCKKNHKSINCMTVTEPKARRTILRRNGKCFVCLKGGHISTNCPSRAKCFNCEGRQHVTICERIRNTLTSRNVVREEASPRGSGSCQDGSRDAGTSAMHISNNANSVLLQIAQAFVCRPDNEQLGLNAHVIFDSCSQRSYITSQAREKLNLPTIGKETLLIKTFGDNSASVKECDVVQLCVRTLDGMNVYITSYVVPVICSPVSNQQSQGTLECYPYLQGLQLACDTSDSVNVDVLIGADYYWSFFTGNIIKGDPYGPVALETNLGWVLSGPSVCSRFTRSCTVNLSSTHVLKIESTHMSDMKDDLQKFWDLETLGIKEHETSVYDKHHLNTCLPVDSALARELLKSLYVDDYVSGKGDVGSAFTLSKEIKLCLKSGGFNMRKWSSNSESLLRSLEQDEAFSDDFEKSNRPKVAEEDESFSKSVFKHSSEKEQRVLGMLWNPTQDELIYDLNKTLGEVDAQPVTKRLILSTATRFFDPLGLIAPVILPLKMMFQKLCKDGKDWDELIDAELNHQWLTTLSDLRQTGR